MRKLFRGHASERDSKYMDGIRLLAGLLLAGILTPAQAAGVANTGAEWDAVVIGIALAAEPDEPAPPPPMLDPNGLDPTALQPTELDTLGGCSALLEQFLADTQFIQPLLDFLSCSGEGYVPQQLMAMASAAQDMVADTVLVDPDATMHYVSQSAESLRGYTAEAILPCYLTTGGYVAASGQGAMQGWTQCFAPTQDNPLAFNQAMALTGRVQLRGYINGAFLGPDSGVVSRNGAVLVARANSLVTNHTGVMFTQYFATIKAPASVCPQSGDCEVLWVVLPNKAPNTGSKLACKSETLFGMGGGSLSCLVESLPFTKDTVGAVPEEPGS